MDFLKSLVIKFGISKDANVLFRKNKKEMFALHYKLLRFSGLQLFQSAKHPKLLLVLNILAVLCVTECLLAEGYYVIKNFDDIKTSTESIAPICTAVSTIPKLLTILLNRKKFYKLLNGIEGLATNLPKDQHGPISKANRINRLIIVTYLAGAAATIAAFVLRSIVINYIQGNEFEYEMPVKSAFPFKVDVSPVFEIQYAIFCFGGFLSVVVNVS